MAEQESHLHEFFDAINVITTDMFSVEQIAHAARTLGMKGFSERLDAIVVRTKRSVKTMQDAYTLDTKRYHD